MSAQDALAQIAQRAERGANALPDGEGADGRALDTIVIQDVPRMEKALRAVLDLADHDESRGDTVQPDDIRAVIEQHLNDETKEDDDE